MVDAGEMLRRADGEAVGGDAGKTHKPRSVPLTVLLFMK